MIDHGTGVSGLRVLVTGAATGIGRAIAETLADGGACVHLCDSNAGHVAAASRERPDIGATQADVSSLADVDRLFADVEARLGGLDALVNNAGVGGPTAPIEEVAVADWLRTFEVNVHGVFLCTRRAVPLLKRGGGAIINIASVAGRVGYPLKTAYSSSKWAVVGFTKGLAGELGAFGIRANAVLPTMVAGERIRSVIAARAKALDVSVEEVERSFLAGNSLHRMVEIDEIASMVRYLLSPAGRGISGQAISICGNTEMVR